MNTIVVSDVFGKTPALVSFSNALNAVDIIDPYDGVNMNFKSEAEAYSYFVENVGLDGYLKKLTEKVQGLDSKSRLIGFSVGASVIWRLSEMVLSNTIDRAICFYGSQIRKFTIIEPLFKIEVILPASEPHFDVSELQKNLFDKLNITINRVPYLHGFMNSHSDNYHQEGYEEYIRILLIS